MSAGHWATVALRCAHLGVLAMPTVVLIILIVYALGLSVVGVPALIIAKRMGVGGWYWAAVPLGDLITLRRATGCSGFSAVWPALLACVMPVGAWAVWRETCRMLGVNTLWVWVLWIPLVNIPAARHVAGAGVSRRSRLPFPAASQSGSPAGTRS